MKTPVAPFVLALVSLILAPILVWVEFIALLFSGMVVAEPANSTLEKALTVVVVVLIGLVALVVPLVALVKGRKARAVAKSTSASASGLATASLVIAGVVTAGVVIAQVYMILMVFGFCSLEGC